MKVLVVEDDERIRAQVCQALAGEGHEVLAASTAEEAMALVQHARPEVYLLDVGLPGLSGTELCRWLRNSGAKEPIVMLTALSGLSDKLEGLDAGADDYLTKPFEIAELLARVRALGRKARGYPRAAMLIGDLRVDPETLAVSRGGAAIDLSRKEFQLLDYLARNHGRLVTRAMIAAAVWDSNTSLYTNVIDVFIANLRRKLGEHGASLIHTVRGKGFVLAEQAPEAAS